MPRLLATEGRARRRPAPRGRTGRRPGSPGRRCPFSAMARRKPRFDMTVTTTVLPARRPRPARSVAKRARSSSPVVAAPVWSTATSRSASPSRARPIVAPRARPPRRPTRSGWVDPHPSLMLVPSGSQAMASTVAPRRSRTTGAMAEAAPLAQSTTTRRPSRDATLEGGHQVLDVAVGGVGIGRQATHGATGRRPRATDRRRRGRGRAPPRRPPRPRRAASGRRWRRASPRCR